MNFSRNAALWLVIVLLLFALFNLFQGSTRGPQPPLAFSDFVDQVESGQVLEVTIAGQEIEGRFRDGREFKSFVPETTNLVETRRANGLEVEGYPFDRVTGATPGDTVIRMIPANGGDRVTIPVDDIEQLRFTGRDTAAGKSFETWMKKYVEKKLAGKVAQIESEEL